jgi:hypothetical protein
MKKRAWFIGAGLVFFGAAGFAVDAAPNISAALSASPTVSSGPCPAVIQFNGQIVLRSQAPCRIQYKFIRSDGAHTSVQTLNFEKVGPKAVSTAWTLGGAGLPTYEGWEGIEVIAPVSAASNKAAFKMQCVGGSDNPGGPKPDLGMYGFLKIGKQQKEVRWGETVTLTPVDATLMANGKPAFEVYYAYRENNNSAVVGSFKNKIFFNAKLVSQ